MRLALLVVMLAACASQPRPGAPRPPGAPGAPGPPSATDVTDAIDAYVHRVMDTAHVPGIGVAVIRAGAIEKLAVYGVANLEWQVPLTTDTRFQIASSTKIFTGTLVMLLVQDGTLALADPVSKHLPDAPDPWRDVTVAHLAAHASGIPPDDFDPKLGSVADAYAVVRDRPLAFPVGTRADYGNGDFLVLVHLLERVSGMTFRELLRTRLIEPLGLTCTTYEDARDEVTTRTAQVIPHRAAVYRWDGTQQRLHWFLYPPYTYAMGGAFSCLSDLATWAAAMDRGTLLSPESERRAATPFQLAGGAAAGFGVVFATHTQRGRRRYGHSGGPALADVLRVPDAKLTVIVLANQQRLVPNLAPTIASLLLPAAPDAALADADPELSRRLRATAASIQTGTLDPSSCAPAKRTELVATTREWGPILGGGWPPIDRWALIEDRPGSPRTRVYRAHHGSIAVRWSFVLDDAGLLLDFEADPD